MGNIGDSGVVILLLPWDHSPEIGVILFSFLAELDSITFHISQYFFAFHIR